MKRAPLLLALLLGLAACARLAHADDRPPRVVGLHWGNGRLAVSVGLRDLFQPEDAARLRSGLSSRVIIRVELLREAPGPMALLATALFRSDLLYDIWDERFRVRIWAPGATIPGPPVEIARVEDAITRATSLVTFPVVDRLGLPPGATYRLRFRADLNPISEEHASEVRRWLVRPPAPGRSSDSLFGSFISIFVNPRIEESERQISFLSQRFVEPSR